MSFGMNVAPTATTASSTIRYATPIAWPRLILVRRSIRRTSGSSASARNNEMTTHERTWREIQITSSVTAISSTIRSTRKMVRGRNSTTRSAVTHNSIAGGPDGVRLRAMSLRVSPAVEHASLPHGGTVTVWVGIPDDPYIEDKSQLTTVDIQLHEGNGVVASVETVLDPDQESEARQLARDVKAAIEAGEIGLHAQELERFADELR